MPDDRELMIAVRNGDLDKLGVLFERHHRSLYRFFMAQSLGREEAEDLVQEVFYKLLRHRGTYKGASKFTTWMYRVAINTKIDYLRSRKRRTRETEIYDSIPSGEPSPEELTMDRNEKALLMKALDRLTDEKREALTLKRFENMKYHEIAEVTGCKEGTVKARVHWALIDLAREYRKLAGVNPS